MLMTLKELEQIISDKLDYALFNSSDIGINGVQVGDLTQEIGKIALMVDSSLEGFKQAKQNGCNLILVHHGLFWGRPIPIKGDHYKRVKFLMDNNISLLASHLPLDAHMELGNAVGLAKKLELEEVEQCFNHKGNNLGIKGSLKEPLSLNEINRAIVGNNDPSYIIPGGKSLVKTIGIATGDGPRSVFDAIDAGLDLYITGDKSHEIYHNCIEAGINVICAGHYATETEGVKLLGKWLEEQYGLQTVFIDLPTGA